MPILSITFCLVPPSDLNCVLWLGPYGAVNTLAVIKTSQLICTEIIPVCSKIRTKHMNTLCGQRVEFVNVKTWWHIKYPLGFEELICKSPCSIAVFLSLRMFPLNK